MVRDTVAPLPTPRQLAWLLVQPIVALNRAEAAVVERVEQDAQAKAVAALASRFTALVRAHGASRCQPRSHSLVVDLEIWLNEARTCFVSAIATFATGLEADGAAVCAALTLPWSNGQTEGQVTRLKLLKRQMYGRASFDLLRRRVLLAA